MPAVVAGHDDIGHNTIENTLVREVVQRAPQLRATVRDNAENYGADVIPMMIPSRLSTRSNFAMCLALALLLSAGFSGCGGKILPTNYYVLEFPPAPLVQVDPFPASVVVMPFRASQMLTQDRIVYRPAAGEVGFYEYHRWAEDPRQTITSTLIERLRARRTFETVVPFDGRTEADYILRGRIEKLEEVDFGGGVSVHVRLSAELVSFDERKAVWQGVSEQKGQVAVGEVSAVVAEMSRAARVGLDKLCADLDGWIRTNVTPPAREEARSP